MHLIISGIVTAILIVLFLNIGKRRVKASTFHGPAFSKPSRFQQPTQDTPLEQLTDELYLQPEKQDSPQKSLPKDKPLLRRFPTAERTDNGHSPLDTAPEPPLPSFSKFLDNLLLTAEDLQVDAKDNRDLPLTDKKDADNKDADNKDADNKDAKS